MLRATQRLEEARFKLADAESARKRASTQRQDLEDQRSRVEDSNTRKAIEGKLPEVKQSLEMWVTEEQRRQAMESEALGQLRGEQAKLGELQDSLDKLDKLPENFNRPSASSPR